MRLLRRAPAEPARPARPTRAARATRTASPTQVGKNLADGIRQFFYDTKSELRKVVWPSREQAVNLTGLVIAVSVAVAAFIGLVDLIVEKVFVLLLGGA